MKNGAGAARVLLLAKAPRPGFVKTRLAADVGEEAAARIYRTAGRRVADQVGDAWPLTVWYAPAGSEDEMRRWLGERDLRLQPAGDLGTRLAFAFDAHFGLGDGPVIAIGADAPDVGAGIVQAAVDALERVDVVLGPAADGGYYLIGLNRLEPAVFRDIAWGGPRVLRDTISRCEAAGLRHSLLPELRDLDTLDDVRSWRGDGGSLARRPVEEADEVD